MCSIILHLLTAISRIHWFVRMPRLKITVRVSVDLPSVVIIVYYICERFYTRRNSFDIARLFPEGPIILDRVL